MITRRQMVAGLAGLSTLPKLLHAAPQARPRVETRHGIVEGVRADGIDVFRGMPYGAPTGGANRFMPPAPPAPWTGVRSADRYGNRAPQTPVNPPPPERPQPTYNLASAMRVSEPESEDCLVLNVWSPSVSDGRRRPVMVWIHAGGFGVGSGGAPHTDGAALARLGDVVVVSLNHRLGVLGYAYLGDIDAGMRDKANVGQLDQVAALEWVRDNIAAFGGDPNDVTLFGQSGGGAKICTLMAMPAARGLFHKAICQSGSYIEATSPELATRAMRAVMQDLGVSALAGLRQVTHAQLISAQHRVARGAQFRGFDPTLDGVSLPFHPFSPEAVALSSGVPLMIGSTRLEASRLARDADVFTLTWDKLPAKWVEGFMRNDRSDRGTISLEEAARTIGAFRAAYPNENASRIYLRAASNLWTIFDAVNIADAQSSGGKAPVWLYELGYETPVDGGRWGSPHGLDVPLVFGNMKAAASMVPDDAASRAVSRQMSGAWLAFAKTGNPNGSGRLAWPRYDARTRPAMVFDVESRVEQDYRAVDRRILAGKPTLRW
ncbi:carboxylesterase/lipase family protein [Telluria beijingensis]|uniref:carboxylesterase/lipase family protein n=1 Tax=Telluria beijingensis TaxID=3068633 RepID=UPI0027954566|nr:carboxylesterase/lipase family protein [Massilia sp. REN29]